MTEYLDPHFIQALCRDPERRTLQVSVYDTYSCVCVCVCVCVHILIMCVKAGRREKNEGERERLKQAETRECIVRMRMMK